MDNADNPRWENRSGGTNPPWVEEIFRHVVADNKMGSGVSDAWLIIWADQHWTSAPNPRELLRQIGLMQHPKMSIREVRRILCHRYYVLSGGEIIRPPLRSREFVMLMARLGMFKLYVLS